MRARILCLLALCFAAEGFAAKKDYKGLFGSYRREKFTENEARSTDFGMDIMLSTLMPISSIVNTSTVRGQNGSPMYYATFFNVEGTFFFTLNYRWEVFLNTGYYSYQTRQQNGTGTGAGQAAGTPLFALYEMSTVPFTFGAKYRFSTSDIVPYVGAGIGAAMFWRKAYYDFSNTSQIDTHPYWALTGQATLGVEFFISSRTGIRLEASAMYMGLPANTFDNLGTPSITPLINSQANPISVRYASGVFVLF
jgi:outer membrane protein W